MDGVPSPDQDLQADFHELPTLDVFLCLRDDVRRGNSPIAVVPHGREVPVNLGAAQVAAGPQFQQLRFSHPTQLAAVLKNCVNSTISVRRNTNPSFGVLRVFFLLVVHDDSVHTVVNQVRGLIWEPYLVNAEQFGRVICGVKYLRKQNSHISILFG